MHLAYMTVSGRGMIDGLIAEVVKAFKQDGVRLRYKIMAEGMGLTSNPLWQLSY